MLIFSRFSPRSRTSMLASTAIAALMLSATTVLAQTTPIETITVTGEKAVDTATGVAPTVTPLDAIQPTSVISQDFIEKRVPPSANYDEAIKYSPSVSDTAPNGPGLAESQGLSIRGFLDGQFNVTFDGIPWGDSNDFTHHSTSYFMAHDLGQISVDRGPGTAASIGNATFGGTVSILSKAPADQKAITPYASYGSFNTGLYGVELDSGAIDKTNGTRVMLDAEGLQSDGYLTNEGQQRKNIYIKVVQPIGADTTVTFVGMYNHLDQNISLGATAAEIASFGPNYGLSKDPTSQNYYKDNQDRITDDFEYVDLNSRLPDGWAIDSKVYTYGYYHHGLNGEDPNGDTPNGTLVGTTFFPNDVPGQALTNDYRSFGTITRLTRDFSFGDLNAGIWYDRQNNSRALYEVDFSNNGALNLAGVDGNSPTGIDRLLTQTLTTLQPYLQFDWKPIDGLTLTPGVRYSYFDRNVNSQVNVKTGNPQVYDNTFEAVLPSFNANYAITSSWAAYAQVAKGFLAPNENFFNTVTPATTNLAPQQTWNYQFGTTWQTPNWSVSADAYYIDFSNLITSHNVGSQTVYFNSGGATYKGVEADATYLLGDGFSVYGNGSYNRAKDSNGAWLPNTPEATGALGLMYNNTGYYGSIMGKWIGGRYGDVGTQWLSPYATIDVAGGLDLSQLSSALNETWIKVQLNNLADTNKIFALAGYTANLGTPLYWTVPGRSVFVSISSSL